MRHAELGLRKREAAPWARVGNRLRFASTLSVTFLDKELQRGGFYSLEHSTIAFAPRSSLAPLGPGGADLGGPGYEGAHQIMECARDWLSLRPFSILAPHVRIFPRSRLEL